VRRWLVPLALLLSVGVNLGILATLGLQHWRGGHEPPPGPPPEEGAPPPGELEGRRPNVGPLADRLGLVGEPRHRFIEMQERFVAGMRERRFELQSLQGALRAELVAERPDRARVEELTTRLGNAYAQLDRSLAENILASRELLTVQQQRQFLRFVESRLQQLRGGERPPIARARPPLFPFRRPFRDAAEPPPPPAPR